MLCCEIHQEDSGCKQSIPEMSNWQFCPICGRSTGHIVQPDGTFTLPLSESATRTINLSNTGKTAVPIFVYLEPEVENLRLIGTSNLAVIPRALTSIDLCIPPLQISRRIGTLVIEANDTALDGSDDPWQLSKKRFIRVPLNVEIDGPSSIKPLHEIAFFRTGLSERKIDLVNEGRYPIDIVDVRCPSGYSITPNSGVIQSSKRLTFTIRRDWTATVATQSELLFRSSNDQWVKVILHSQSPGDIIQLPRAIIGIDFGTAFTSVSFRECRHTTLRDDIKFLRPSNEDTDRFPTRIWLGKNGDFGFGSKATEMYHEDPTAGYIFREIKTLLRDNNENKVFIHPDPPNLPQIRSEGLQFVKERFGDAWHEVLATEYLKWINNSLILPELRQRFGTPDASIRYVFSLPVLDFATEQNLYNQQKTKMERCIRNAGFPMENVEFQFEPVCASLGLLNPPSDKWPQLGGADYPINEGDSIVIFDSGGGTTDIALAVTEFTGENGRLTLRVKNCLGVGSEAETFGGEEVTSRLIEALKSPVSVEGDPWWRGTIDIDAILGKIDDLALRDEAEELKQDLASNDGKSLKVGSGDSQGTIRPVILQRLITSRLKSLAIELIDQLFKIRSRSDTRFYLCVGGNTYLPAFEKWVGIFMQDETPEQSGRRLHIPDEYRKLAIAYGAAWVPDARIHNAVPYDITIKVGSLDFLTLPRNTSGDIIPRSRPYSIPPRQDIKVRIEASLAGGIYCACSESISNPYDSTAHLDLHTDVQNGTIGIMYSIRALDDQRTDIERQALIKYVL